jgi:membrane associated rhomboid family serine protease
MFNIPGSVLALLAVMVAVHLVRLSLPEDAGAWLTLALAFITARYAGLANALPGGTISSVTSFLTHAFVHADFVHLGINAAWLVAFGGAVANRIGALHFLLFFGFCAVVGAATFLVFNPGLMVPMIGASGAISGLMGGTMRFMFSAFDSDGFAALRESPRSVPLMPLRQAVTDKRVLLVTGAFLGANILAVLGLGGLGESGIAWEAHIGGYFGGLLTFGFFDPRQTHRSSTEPNMN